MHSIVQDELESIPTLEAVHLSAHIVDESLSMSLTYIGPNGVHMGEVGL
jgi:hypothetical protein